MKEKIICVFKKFLIYILIYSILPLIAICFTSLIVSFYWSKASFNYPGLISIITGFLAYTIWYFIIL